MDNEIMSAVKVRPAIFSAIEKIVAQSQKFDTVDDYVNFVLSELLSGEDAAQAKGDEQRQVETRLRQLGYLS